MALYARLLLHQVVISLQQDVRVVLGRLRCWSNWEGLALRLVSLSGGVDEQGPGAGATIFSNLQRSHNEQTDCITKRRVNLYSLSNNSHDVADNVHAEDEAHVSSRYLGIHTSPRRQHREAESLRQWVHIEACSRCLKLRRMSIRVRNWCKDGVSSGAVWVDHPCSGRPDRREQE